MNSTLPIILTLFPVYSSFGFSIVYILLERKGIPKQEIHLLLSKNGLYVHSALLVPLLLLGLLTFPPDVLIAITGLSLHLLLWIAVGLILGTVLFVTSFFFVRCVFSSKRAKIAFHLTKSCTSVILVVTPFMEDFLWRGVLITFLLSIGLPAILALLFSAVSFGIMHYWFGVREMLFKSFDGVFFGILFMLSGSFIASGFAHVLYNQLVYGYNEKRRRNDQSKG